MGRAAGNMGDGRQGFKDLHACPALPWHALAWQVAPRHHLAAGSQADAEGAASRHMHRTPFPLQRLHSTPAL